MQGSRFGLRSGWGGRGSEFVLLPEVAGDECQVEPKGLAAAERMDVAVALPAAPYQLLIRGGRGLHHRHQAGLAVGRVNGKESTLAIICGDLTGGGFFLLPIEKVGKRAILLSGSTPSGLLHPKGIT